MRSGLICRSGAIAGRMACILAVALLACASVAHGQVIEEGGFPVKGGGVSGESFSLSCPPRLVVGAGESVLLSCSATAAPEEGVRYEWESLSGDGFHLLSASDELSPLFTAPLPGEGAEYEYRLTAMSVGVYETATVTVTVGGFVGEGQEAFEAPGEECGLFGGFGRGLEGCQPWEKAPPRDFFGGSPEDEEIVPWPSFPESPGAEDKEFAGSSGAGPFPQTPPYLECPVAVFLEELETGAIECHAWDALGEEHLEYEWEPVGNTTRDYLDNPRLLPEDVPNPSVVAPEAPVYETLESFHSGETTFRYRYRLTATSRATGLSSSSEVEVYVSSSRPSVYCPLEVAVEEGETAQLDCEGVDPLSHRMDYDEEGASILWEWEGLWGTSTAHLDETDLSSPVFEAPPGSAGSQYHYIASMTSSASGVARTARRRVTVTVTGGEEVTVTAVEPATDGFPSPGNKHLLAFEVACNGILDKGYLYEVRAEGPDKVLDCEASGGPDGVEPTCAWTGSASDLAKLSATDICDPTFDVPFSIYPSQRLITYPYDLRASAGGATTQPLRVLVNVHARLHTQIYCTGTGTGAFNYVLYEGTNNFTIPCREVPGGPPNTHTWTAAPGTPINLLNPTNILTPTFTVPDDVSGHQTYVYIFTITNNFPGDPLSQQFTLTVLDLDPSLTCEDSDVGEGTGTIRLDCSVVNEPSGVAYSWEGRGSTSDTSLLTSGTDTLTPTFSVPGNVGADTHYEYRVTLSAPGINNVTADVRVTVRDTDPSVTCRDADVIEATADFTLDCSVENEPSGATYAWTARGSTSGTSLLISTTALNPTFTVPDDIDADTDYDYTVTLSASGIDDITADVTVTVLEKPDIYCSQYGEGELTAAFLAYEGHTDRSLNTCESGWAGAPGANPVYTYAWTARGSTPDTRRLSATNIEVPTFSIPNTIEITEFHYYTLTVSAENADDASVPVRVEVRNAVILVCKGPYEVDEGDADIELECDASSGPPGSTYTWKWIPSTNLTDHNTGTPTFAVPDDIDQDTTWTYKVTSETENIDYALHGTAEVMVTVRDTDSTDPSLTCTDSEVYEGAADITLDCSVTNEPSGATYAWAVRGSTSDTNDLSSTTILAPTFDVPENVDVDTDYTYTVTLSASGINDVTEDVTLTVKNNPQIILDCGNGPGLSLAVGIGDTDSYGFSCSASGAPEGSIYSYAWTARDPTPNTDLLSATDMSSTQFTALDISVPYMDFHYKVTATADNAEDGSLDIRIRVRDMDARPPVVTCNNPDPVYEGSDDIVLDCTVTNEPSGATYAWTARGSTANTALLSSTTILKPTFDVPGSVNAATDYEYTVTLSASGINDVTEDVTVTVLNKEPLTLICTPPPSPLYEGSEDFALDCSASGAPSGSDYVYEWTARGGGDTSKLSSTTVRNPTFDVPEEVDADETYEYTLTVSAENAEDATANVTVRVLDKKPLTLICTPPPSPLYEGSEDFALDCSASGAPSGSDYVYEWTARGGGDTSKLSSTTVRNPTFDVPEEVDADETYEYTLTVSAENAEDATANVTVRVLDKKPLTLICTPPPSPLYEGSEDFALDCSASGAPSGSDYVYEWTARGGGDTSKLSSTTVRNPTFDVPEEVDADETYEYTLTVSADNAEDVTANVTVQVLNKKPLTLICTPPTPVYEGAEDFDLDCSASGAPAGSVPVYVWTARGSTANTDELSSTTIAKPTFDVPEEVDGDETYEYLLTVSADNAESATEDVTVTVLNKKALDVACATPSPVYEGSEDFALDCAATGAPAGSDYTYVWTGRGTTSNTDLLVSGTDGPTPTFDVPEEVDEDETYEYLLTVSAENAIDAAAEVTVKVLNLGSIALVCASPPLVYEGSEDFALDCSILGDTGDTDYTYEWTARGATANSDLLIAGTDGPTPTFAVPDQLDATTTYEYLLTARAANVEDATAEVTVTVLNRGTLAVACAPPPLVYEGAEGFALDCTASGAPAGSEYAYVWTARGATSNTDLLIAGTDGPTPTFDVPDALDRATTYEYLLTVSAENAESGSAAVTVTVLNRGALSVVCVDPPSVYEGSADFDLDCSASGAPAGSEYAYVWTARGSTANTALLIAGTDGPTPTFSVPEELDRATTYEYLLTVSAENAESGSAAVTVTVLNRGALSVVCMDPSSVYEGSADFALDCSASGAPAGSEYVYVWTARGSTENTLQLSATDISSPTFYVPDEVDETTTYEYLLTASAENAESGSAAVTVTVLNRGALSVVCASPASVYEGSENFSFDCSASGAPAGSTYEYAWTARGSTANTDLLIAGTDGPTPTFDVPDALDRATTYEYLLTVSADNAESGSAAVTVTVLNRGALSVVCADPPSIYEGSEDFALDCTASGAPAGSEYAYVWTAQGDTENALQLSATDIPSPTFYVPDEVDETTTYEYLLTASAENMEDGAAEVTVTVLKHGTLSVVCADPPSIYEGSEDFALDCTASGAPAGSEYAYVWTAQGDTENTLQLSRADIPSPTFYVPDEVDETTTYEYLLTASAENMEDGAAEVTVTVLNRGALSVVCMDPGSVYEGSEDITLDCTASGAPAGSEYAYIWTARGSTANTALLIAGTDGPTPTFSVPEELDRATTYEYLLTVSAENANSGTAEVSVTVLNRGPLSVVCADPPSIYEGSADVELDCTASGAPSGSEYDYVWTARGSTANTDQLSATDISSPTFYVPDEVDETTTYEYLLTASAENAESGSAAVTVTVLNRGALSVVCASPASVYEGSENFSFDCSASGAPAGSTYEYAWTARGSTANTDLLIAGTDGPTPTFDVPEELDRATTYEYLLTVSADNAEDGAAEVTVTVLNRGALSVVCADPPSIYEGSEDFALDCTASGAPAGSEYAYVWTARGSTANTALLSRADIPSPTFYVPDEVDETTTYEYLLTASAENMEDGAAEVTVTVLNHGPLSVVCADPPSIYEGSEDFALDCSASGAPAGSEYAYVWTAQGDTENTLQLSRADISSPTFYVPDEVDETTTYEYLLTASAENMEDGAAEVTVTVLNRGGALSVVCMAPGSVYEGSEDITLDCTASGAPEGSEYAYVWTAQGDTENTLQLSATDIPSPTFYVPDAVDVATDYEYLLTVSAENAEDGAAEVVVTVLSREALSVVCMDPGSVYEGSEDFAFNCTASGAPPGPEYTYVWTGC